MIRFRPAALILRFGFAGVSDFSAFLSVFTEIAPNCTPPYIGRIDDEKAWTDH